MNSAAVTIETSALSATLNSDAFAPLQVVDPSAAQELLPSAQLIVSRRTFAEIAASQCGSSGSDADAASATAWVAKKRTAGWATRRLRERWQGER